MYLAVMLIIVAVLVFYNEYNNKMNIAEIGLLIVALIAIIRASINYININNTSSFNKLEEFTSQTNFKSNNKIKNKNKTENVIILESSKSKEYFDTNESEESHDNSFNITQQTTHNEVMPLLSKKNIDLDAVRQVNNLLGISSTNTRSQSNFNNISLPSTTKISNSEISSENGIDSIFVPQIQIGKSISDSLYDDKDINIKGVNMSKLGVPNIANLASTATSLNGGDNMTFPNTMKPSSNLWSSDLDYMDTSTNWSQSMADYNKGKWHPNTYAKASDYIDYYTPSANDINTPQNTDLIDISSSSTSSKSQFTNIPTTTTPTTNLDSNGNTPKLCGAYDNLSLDQAGNLVVKNYTQAKKWMPGYTYVPPVYWDVPQKHINTCQMANPNVHKLTGIVDRGLPINALELNPDGSMADNENTVTLTNIGSILPKFNYEETPFSKPYI